MKIKDLCTPASHISLMFLSSSIAEVSSFFNVSSLPKAVQFKPNLNSKRLVRKIFNDTHICCIITHMSKKKLKVITEAF